MVVRVMYEDRNNDKRVCGADEIFEDTCLNPKNNFVPEKCIVMFVDGGREKLATFCPDNAMRDRLFNTALETGTLTLGGGSVYDWESIVSFAEGADSPYYEHEVAKAKLLWEDYLLNEFE